MRIHRTVLPCAALLAASLMTCTSPPNKRSVEPGLAPGTDGAGKSIFAAPELLMAGGVEMGSTSLYPSPVFLDVDGDGQREMVIGGLRGYLSVAKPTKDGWAKEERLKAVDGKALKFHNW